MKNKIGWCNTTWNPVWGCNNHCEYCYARKIAKRFWRNVFNTEDEIRKIIDNVTFFIEGEAYIRYREDFKSFKPTFLQSQFLKEFPKKPQRIFVGSMSEIAHWEANWVNKVIFKIYEYPQHIFQFLTKYPEVYSKYDFPKNCWLGITITEENDFYNDIWALVKFLETNYKDNNIKYVSFEPLLSKMHSYKYLKHFDWVILGAETGNRKGKVIPKKEWIDDIVDYCKRDKIPVYLKDNLKEIYPVEIKEFPEVK